jgi:hypothetical protein
MKNLETYKEYEIEQWLEDADFVGWVKNPTGNAGAFFTSLMAKDVQLARRSGGQVWNQQRSNLALGGYEKIPDVV